MTKNRKQKIEKIRYIGDVLDNLSEYLSDETKENLHEEIKKTKKELSEGK